MRLHQSEAALPDEMLQVCLWYAAGTPQHTSLVPGAGGGWGPQVTSQLGRARAPGLGEVLASHTAGQQAQDPTTPISGGPGAKPEETPCLHPFSRWEDYGLVQLLSSGGRAHLALLFIHGSLLRRGEQRENPAKEAATPQLS